MKASADKAAPVNRGAGSPQPAQVAVIQGRFCLAYQGSYCSVCYERCPVPGAIDFHDAMPRVVLEHCTGCAVCHDVCPAPRNAILLTPRRPGVGA